MDLWRFVLRDVVAALDRDRASEDAQAIELEARQFLRDLDPESQEGMWFEAFAERFESRQEAALMYVRDVKRSA